MTIQFQCPHCFKLYNLKDELAGKKAACKVCKTVITVPKPAAAGELEDLAASAFADEPPPVPKEDTSTIDLPCPFCGEQVHFAAKMAGKQAPCPECRRIIKVPLPTKKGPLDWRKADAHLPSAARRDTDPAPDGAWGTETSAGGASRETLKKVRELTEEREPISMRTWIIIGTTTAVVLFVALGVGWWGYSAWTRNERNDAVNRALQAVEANKVAPEVAAAEVHRGAGEYYLRDNRPEDARKQLVLARGRLQSMVASGPDHEVLLGRVAMTQADLGSAPVAGQPQTGPSWDDAQQELEKTLPLFPSSEARRMTLRSLIHSWVGRDMSDRLVRMARLGVLMPDEIPEVVGMIGLELHRSSKPEAAAARMQEVMILYPPESDQVVRPALTPSVVALSLVLGSKPDLAPTKKNKERDELAIRIGQAIALGYQGKMNEVPARVQDLGPEARFQAIAGAVEANPAEAGELLDKAANDSALKGAPPWTLFRLTRLALQSNHIEKAELARKFAAALGNPRLAAMARLEVYMATLEETKGKKDESGLDEVGDKESLAYALAREALARHNARHDGIGNTVDAVDKWSPDTMRPLGLVGAVLGAQDGSQ